MKSFKRFSFPPPHVYLSLAHSLYRIYCLSSCFESLSLEGQQWPPLRRRRGWRRQYCGHSIQLPTATLLSLVFLCCQNLKQCRVKFPPFLLFLQLLLPPRFHPPMAQILKLRLLSNRKKASFWNPMFLLKLMTNFKEKSYYYLFRFKSVLVYNFCP